ncbi:MAG: nucleotidyltransferase domain-containing protein [Epsilonproteobacteria bacterium]|nr:nucleotidyltransferase domain-containing protein [Campylobacterota bacterium]
MNDGLTPERKNHILRAMEYHFPGAKVILFGSRARGDFHEGSDIDIAVDAGKKVDRYELYRARVTVEHLPLGLKIDLVDFHRVSELLREVIEKEGVVWKKRKTPVLLFLS